MVGGIQGDTRRNISFRRKIYLQMGQCHEIAENSYTVAHEN